MGCDIHAYIEYLRHGNEQFTLFCKPYIRRWPALFSLMAGVRCFSEFLPIIDPRGLPENMDIETAYDYRKQAADAHHCSWLHLTELRAISHKVPNFCDMPELIATLGAMSVLEGGGYAVRLVFWFDN